MRKTEHTFDVDGRNWTIKLKGKYWQINTMIDRKLLKRSLKKTNHIEAEKVARKLIGEAMAGHWTTEFDQKLQSKGNYSSLSESFSPSMKTGKTTRSFRINNDIWELLKREARRRDTTASALVNQAIIEYVSGVMKKEGGVKVTDIIQIIGSLEGQTNKMVSLLHDAKKKLKVKKKRNR